MKRQYRLLCVKMKHFLKLELMINEHSLFLRILLLMKIFAPVCLCIFSCSQLLAAEPFFGESKSVYFKNGSLTLGGELFLPKGKGPFPFVLYNHGSAPGMLNRRASEIIAPFFLAQGWGFFMPYRRGQGLSSKAGAYIVDQIHAAEKAGGKTGAVHKMVELLGGEQLDDQKAALRWLRRQKFSQVNRIAVAGNSFGGIQSILGSAQENYCAAVSGSAAAESWSAALELQQLLKESVRVSNSPILFFQAENDFDLEPIRVLSAEMEKVGRVSEIKIYPSYGKTEKDGHSFACMGASIWFDDVFNFIQKYCP